MAESRVINTAGRAADEAAIEKFRTAVRGDVLCPGQDGYDAARRVFNAMIDKRPGLIVRCAGAADVVACVNFAREQELPVSVRGGGHSVAGKAVCDGGLMIDLSPMKEIRVDPLRRIAHAQPGLRLGEFDRETQAFGLATTLGVASITGIAGLTLGGGIGWLNGKYGLACDNLLSVDVVTAGGQLLTASATHNEDLFWAVRGGSGNFGVVTSFEYQLHSVGPVLGGMVIHPFYKAKEVLRFYQDFSASCPDELSTVAAVLTGPDAKPAVAIAVCYCGSLTEGERLVKPLRSFGPPVADLLQPMSYVALQGMLDGAFPPDHQHYWKSSFVRNLRDDGIEILVDFMSRKPSPLTFSYLQQVHGAAGRVPPGATAFAHRGDHYDWAILSMWPEPAANERNIAWTKDFFEVMQPFVEQGVYVNNLGEEGDERVRTAYGTNYERLATVKKKYDPANFFRLNHNIPPAA